MSKSILVPLDGSELAAAILIHVRRLVHGEDVEVTLLHVIPADGLESDRNRARVEQLRDDFRAEGARATARVVVGDPAGKILEVADEIAPSLIAMSTHGRSGVARFVRGSVAEKVLSRSRFPLLLANPFALDPREELRIRKILVPLDGSTLSSEILPLAVETARICGSELVLFHAIERARLSFPGSALALTLEDADKLLRSQLERVEGVPVRLRIALDMAAETILDVAKDERADLIALTTHGRSGRSPWAFGSVAQKVLAHATCPLLVLRTGGLPASEPAREATAASAGHA